MKRYHDELTPLQEQALAALLVHPTLEAAARAVGVSDVTIWRWRQQPAFAHQYRALRRQILEDALSELQQSAREAAQALRRHLTCGNPAVEVRAALGVLDQAVKASEWLELEQRLARLERRLAQAGRSVSA